MSGVSECFLCHLEVQNLCGYRSMISPFLSLSLSQAVVLILRCFMACMYK